ncbi:DISARM system phospholipase D-like protein DrmC [Streptomyces lateritius]|uniref:DISARM system phospholipase D-like protein DrmC n=1 Tax=Streptomyces lateritius TaxID=67313 RepID=A0ABW6Y6I7_9ACTN
MSRSPGEHGTGERAAPAVAATAGVPVTRDSAPPPRLPSLLAGLCHRLPADRLVGLEHVLATVTHPDDPFLSRYIQAQSAAGLARQLTEMTRAWHREAPGITGSALALALTTYRALSLPSPPQVVVSGPMGPSLPVRLTSGVAVEVIRSANVTLLIASFAAHGALDVVEEIGLAVARGVQVDLLLEESTHAVTAFAALPPEVRIWHRTGGTGVMHAKLLAADRHTAFLGSANLTDRAMSDNIELGVVLRDRATVEPLVDHFRWLLAPEAQLMRRA